MKRFTSYLSRALLFFSIVFFTFFIITSIFAQQPFSKSVFSALTADNETELTTILKSNRLFVKPLLDSLLTEHIQHNLSGNDPLAKSSLQFAQKIAEHFEQLFGEKSLTEAVKIVSKLSTVEKRQKLAADSLYAVGTKIRAKKQKHKQAIEDYQKALAIYHAIGDKRGEGTVLGGLGFIHWYRILWFKEDPAQALNYAHQALQIRLEVDDKKLIGNSYNDIAGLNFQFVKDYSTALTYYLKAAKIREEIGDDTYLARTYAAIAAVYDRQGELALSGNFYEKAIQLFKKLNDQYRLANALNDAGITLTAQGNFPKALDYLQQSLAIKKQRNDRRRMTTTLSQLSVVYRRLGEMELALKSCQELIAISQQLKDKRGLANAYESTGNILRNMSRFPQALERYQKSLELFREMDNQNGVANQLSNIGLTYFNLKEYKNSEEYLLQALQMNRELQEKTNQTINLINLGNLYGAIDKLDHGLSAYEEAYKKAISLNNPELIWPALLGLGDNSEKRVEFDRAIQYYTEALEIVEGIRSQLIMQTSKASFMGQKRYVYEAVIHLLGRLYGQDKNQNYLQKAFEFAERAKARAFLDLITESLSNVRAGSDKELLQKQEGVARQLSATFQRLQLESKKSNPDKQVLSELEGTLDSLEQNYRTLQREIRLKNPRYSDLQFPKIVALSQVQKNLIDKKTIILAYSLGDSSSAMWGISKDQVQFRLLPPGKVLQEQWEILQFSTSQPQKNNLSYFTQSSHKLFQSLIEPVKKLLRNKGQVIIIPDGFLHYLPFEILLTDPVNPEKASYSDLPYLIKTVPISYCQSVTVLHNLRQSKKQKSFSKQLFAIGDPDFAKSRQLNNQQQDIVFAEQTAYTKKMLPRLMFSGDEVRNISNLFPKDRVSLFLQAEAKEETVKEQLNAGSFRYIHFATHGLINERNPNYSSLAFAFDSDPIEDDYLFTSEIFNLQFNSELVVLSACQSGRGKMVRGEGVMGLTRAFMFAGAPSMIVSLWSVSDISTSELMVNFYKNLIKKGRHKSTALQQAKNELIKDKKYAHPFYWAPFVLIGDWE